MLVMAFSLLDLHARDSLFIFFPLSLFQIIKDPECGGPVDKMRIFLIMYLCSANMTDAEFSEYATALAEAEADTRALLYLKRWKSLMKVTACNV